MKNNSLFGKVARINSLFSEKNMAAQVSFGKFHLNKQRLVMFFGQIRRVVMFGCNAQCHDISAQTQTPHCSCKHSGGG